MSGEVGGLWNYKPQDSEEASVMKSTVINSSKEMSAYSDFPPRPDVANYMHNRRLLEYFQEYAKHYDLLKLIRFHHKVTGIKKAVDYSNTGRWMVEYTDRWADILLSDLTYLRACSLFATAPALDTGVAQNDEFDAVLLCTGHHKVPHWPEKWPGQDEFKGRIVHSHDYKEPIGFEDKRVVAVGIGNSGADIAVELSRVSEQLYLSTRRGAWILNRLHKRGMPLDVCVARRFTHTVLFSIPHSIRSWYVQKTINDRFDHAAYGLQPKHDVFR
ncbi:unnamed protein product [Heligmosomoides polygyrus]|uniref:Flavin-containing monooxygenase n=1 Tax=Heligmosomoides polygyrus TaxID=6339 RepID=A0A183GRU3_HELPZ|nr:unnamed protein product [Heligmosomoides polygyrus]